MKRHPPYAPRHVYKRKPKPGSRRRRIRNGIDWDWQGRAERCPMPPCWRTLSCYDGPVSHYIGKVPRKMKKRLRKLALSQGQCVRGGGRVANRNAMLGRGKMRGDSEEARARFERAKRLGIGNGARANAHRMSVGVGKRGMNIIDRYFFLEYGKTLRGTTL